MSRLLSCNGLVDQALREIGAFSPYDVSADVAEHEIGLERLDLLIAELAGVENLWFLQPARQSVSIPAGETSISLLGLLSPLLQFIGDVRLTLPEAPLQERPLEMVRRATYDAIENKGAAGDPRLAYIERNDSPRVFLYPAASRSGLTLILDGQRYADTATDNLGKNASGFPAAWQRYLIKRLAAELGSGPVRTIPADERVQKIQEAERALALLLSRNNREQIKRPRLVQAWDPLGSGAAPYRRSDYGQ